MFIAALFITIPNWKKQRCPSTGKWINKLCYIHTMEYYSVMKRNELSGHEKIWMNLFFFLKIFGIRFIEMFIDNKVLPFKGVLG